MVLRYDVVPELRRSAAAGVPVDQHEFVYASKLFEGPDIGVQSIADHWSAHVHAINQTARGIVDQRSLRTRADLATLIGTRF
ncbi:MAG TPA: hypothetical protein VEE84_05580 [Burkholderiaceae bacterium]|nr:hypothetical protein [Burkholderiaceae bacterium]